MDTAKYTITVNDLARKFGRHAVFKNINLSVETGRSLCITGPNGSGKSTLLRILAGLQNPTSGTVLLSSGGPIEKALWMDHIGYTGPLVNPYDELTGIENLSFVLKDGGAAQKVSSLLLQFKLDLHGNKKVKHYSSGMKQRLKIILAILNDPPILFLDEAGTNLDSDGTSILHGYLESVRTSKIIILATNDADEEKLCSGVIRLG
ncbi:MAG: ABC transporter ATP-binding protein [Spirochaetes bacterium]|nr:ABC transporter ATP-binding protein [Spirochaetota bacterium]